MSAVLNSTAISLPAGFDSQSTNTAVVPSTPCAGSMCSRMPSSSRINPVACVLPSNATFGPESTSRKSSSGSISTSPMTCTVIVPFVAPAGRNSVPFVGI